MSPNQTPRVPRAVSSCPWCGPGTELTLHYDQMGSVQLSCSICGCHGPKVPIGSDFAAADEVAISLWSKRRDARQLTGDTLSRVNMAIGLHCLTGRLTPDAAISVAWSDLNALLRCVGVPEAASGG